MKPGPDLLKIINRLYEPSAMVSLQFKKYDLDLKTNEQGHAILMFIGQRNEQGLISGHRYARTLLMNKEGLIIKDHWELKGKAS